MSTDISQGETKPAIEKRLILLLATLLLANPIVLFLVFGSALLAAIVTVASVVMIQFSVSSPSRRNLTVFLFNLLALASVGVHSEALLVHGFPEHVIENLYVIKRGYYFNRPLLNQNFRSQEFSVTYRTNGQGFRLGTGQEPSVWVDKVDWLVLGDSFTQGAQVEFEDLYSTRLNARFPDKIVVNAGISGMGVAHEYNYFVDQGQKLSPRLVILQVGSFNDFMNVEAGMASFTDRLMEHSAFARLLLHDWRYGNPAELPLGRWTEPFYPDVQSNRDYNIFFKEGSSRRASDLEAFRQHLVSLNSAVSQSGGALLVALLPTREQVFTESLNEVTSRFGIDHSLLDMRHPNTLLAELAKEVQFELVDLLPAFQRASGDEFFRVDEHLTPHGHSVVAAAIGDYIERKYGPAPAILLSKTFSGDRYPSPSTDGGMLAFQSVRGGTSELFLTSPDFSSIRQLTFDGVDQAHPMLSSDKSRILFTEGSAESHRTKVMLMNVDGSRRISLTPGPEQFGAIATFSPSNLKVVLAEWSLDASGKLTKPQIVVVDLLNGSRRAISKSDREHWRPVFSPDQTHLAYISRIEGQFDVVSYDFATNQEKRLTTTPFDEWDPQFHPDGDHIAYAARKDGNWDLFGIELSSGRVVQMTTTRGDEWDPTFSPDGKLLLFAGKFGFVEAIFSRRIAELLNVRGNHDH
jgi:Tol biopolymer transport system component